MSGRTGTLPYGIGRAGPFWLAVALGLLALVAVGAYAYTQQELQGHIVTGLRDWGSMGGAPWGLYVSFIVYFVGVSFAGITVAALIRLTGRHDLRPLSRAAELLTIVSLVLAAFSVLADLGQPLRGIVNLFRYARPQSPFFGTFTMVIAGYLFASLVYFYLAGRRDAYLMGGYPGPLQGFFRLWAAGYRDTPEQRQRHQRASFWLALGILPLLVIAHSTLGLVFGLMAGRPGWFSALQAPGFVALAGVSGIGHLIVIAALMRQFLGGGEQPALSAFRWLGTLLLGLSLAYVYFTIVEVLTAGYSGHESEQELARLMLVGYYAPYFWTATGALLAAIGLLAYQALSGRWSLPLLVAAGVLVNVTAVGKRLIIVVPSLTHGSLLPYGEGFYSPTWVEGAIIAGLMALGAVAILGFGKVFPLMEVEAPARQEEGVPRAAPGGSPPFSVRGVAALGMVAVGVALMAVSYLRLATPWAFPPSGVEHSDPRLPFAPALFVLGVMTSFLSAVVYELWPERSPPGQAQ
jgi:Ni/Fe-hydrogenase subunit HybB-like protein